MWEISGRRAGDSVQEDCRGPLRTAMSVPGQLCAWGGDGTPAEQNTHGTHHSVWMKERKKEKEGSRERRMEKKKERREEH